MYQKKLNNRMPIWGVAIAMAIISFAGTPGWGFSDEGWSVSTMIGLGMIACAIGLYLEEEPLQQRLLYIIPYTIACVGAVVATQKYLSSTTSTLRIVIFIMAALGAVPGLIIYYIMNKHFEKINAQRFEMENADLIIQWDQTKATMNNDEIFYVTSLKKFLLQNIADDKGKFDKSLIIDSINESCTTKENALRFIKVYEAYHRRDLINDIKEGAKNKKFSKQFLQPFIEYGIVNSEWPHQKNII